jgi:hypothetical protein
MNISYVIVLVLRNLNSIFGTLYEKENKTRNILMFLH